MIKMPILSVILRKVVNVYWYSCLYYNFLKTSFVTYAFVYHRISFEKRVRIMKTGSQ